MIRLRIVSRPLIRLLRWLFSKRNRGTSIADLGKHANPPSQAGTSDKRFDKTPPIPNSVTERVKDIAAETIGLSEPTTALPYSNAAATAGEEQPRPTAKIAAGIEEIVSLNAVIDTTSDIAVESSCIDAVGISETSGERANVAGSVTPLIEDGPDKFNLLENAPNLPANEARATSVAFPDGDFVEKEASTGHELHVEPLDAPVTQTTGEAPGDQASTPNRIDPNEIEVINRPGSSEDMPPLGGEVVVDVLPSDDRVTNQEPTNEVKSSEGMLAYAGLKPQRPATQTRKKSEEGPRIRKTLSSNVETDVRLRVHLVFNNRGEAIRALTLLPDRRDEMPDELEVAGTQGTFSFSRFRDDAYEGIRLPDAGAALLGGVEWRGTPAANQRFQWVLRGREIYVLAPGPLIADVGGFVSVPRLLLNEENLVLARKTVRDDVLSALAATGCNQPTVIEDSALGVPSDWMLFKGVKPSRAVPMRDEQDVFNSLCPLTDIEPHFEGGIKLERQTWLAGHPPAIRFTGAVEDSFAPKIDGRDAEVTAQGYLAGGWDGEGPHELWYADKVARYTIRTCAEDWRGWDAYGLGTGALICGAQVLPMSGEQRRQVRVPRQNSILIGAEPGQIFNSQPRADLRFKDWVAMPPFDPVWAVPINPAHLDKKTARVVAVGETQPVRKIGIRGLGRIEKSRIGAWCSAISEAGRKGLLVEGEEAQAALWREYRVEAKRLKRSLR